MTDYKDTIDQLKQALVDRTKELEMVKRTANKLQSELDKQMENNKFWQTQGQKFARQRDEAELKCAELAAQVEQLQVHNEMLMQASWEMKECVPDAFYKIKNIRNSTPAQCLAEIKAEAGEAGFIAGALRHGGNLYLVRDQAKEYANTIRNQKGGE